MNKKIDPSLLDTLADPNNIVDVIVLVINPSAIEQLSKVKELHVTRVIRFINGVAGRIRAKDIVSLSQSPNVRSIELANEASIVGSD